MLPDLARIEPATSWSPVGRAYTQAGQRLLKYEPLQVPSNMRILHAQNAQIQIVLLMC